MQIAKYFVAAGLTVLWPSCAWAGIYIAPLDGLKGVYSTGDLAPNLREGTFDFGTAFEQIVGVQIHLTGTAAPALYRNYATSEDWEVTPYIGTQVQPLVPPVLPPGHFFLGLNAYMDTKGTFDTEIDLWHPYRDVLTGAWVSEFPYMKDGKGTVELWDGVSVSNPLGDDHWSQVVPPLAGITGAYLIFEGVAATVPEPSVILWTMIGAMMFVSRRRGER